MNDHIQQAADVIETPGSQLPGYPFTSWSRPHGRSIAAALADAGLLVTPEQRAVIAAAVNERTVHLDDRARRVDRMRAYRALHLAVDAAQSPNESTP
jgi:hypothetical protein